jgi:outer membrane protein OmpA-like peptidoglycan-associated protein
MAFNLIETVSGLFSNDLVSKAASSLGESEGGIQKALSGIVPSVLTGLLNKAGSGGNAASGILDLAKQASGSGILNNLSGLLGGGGGGAMSGLLSMAGNIFGDKLGNITNLISSFSGIKSSSASSLISMASPAALGAIGKHASDNNLNAGGLLSMFVSQKDKILSAIPSGLGGLAGALGLSSLGDIGNKLENAISGITGEAKKGMKWLLPVVLIAVAIALLWYFMKGCGSGTATADKDTSTAVVKPAVDETPVVSVPSFKVKLPDGVELDALKGGIEDNLVTFLGDASSKPGKDVWFDFDNLNFETGSAVITTESQKQISNLAAILKAFPKAKIKIGGYTDKTGDAATNKKLSQNRADAVVAALKAAGTNAGQLLGGEGYGSEFAKAAVDASEDESKKDRRIAVSVREK